MIMKTLLPYILAALMIFACYQYYVYLTNKIDSLETNISTLKANMKTKEDKCKEDIIIASKNIKWKTKKIYIEKKILTKETKDEASKARTNNRFYLVPN